MNRQTAELKEKKSAFENAASILSDLGLDTDTINAAVILDSFQNHLPPESAVARLDPVVARLVNGTVKIIRLPVNSQTIRGAQNIRNMIFALTDDIREIIICLALKLHALRVLNASPDSEKQKNLARECLDIYAPLADRLGISWIKDEMEDLSLQFLNHEAYQQIKNIVYQKQEWRGEFLDRARETIIAEAAAAKINVEVRSRAKHFYSVYMKMRKRNKSAAEIYDLAGIRIICDSVENCYTLLGIVHRLWQPISGCFDDYIARPKPNGYQSLHTSVIADITQDTPESIEEEKRLEVQIRTREMHQVAENGVASHWLYKKGSTRDMVQPSEINVVNQLKHWKNDRERNVSAANEFTYSWLDEIKREILRNSIYALTPQGRVIKLPAGATPIDFAYQVHTAIGEHCIGAKSNGSIIPLSGELKNTRVVEILTNPSAHPHPGWLEIVKTNKARSKIRSWLEQNNTTVIAEKNTAGKKKPVIEDHATAAVPLGTENEEPAAQMVLRPSKSILQVRIEDEKNFLVRFALCCNPVSGDPITGYVSRGRGIIIHRKNCSNLAHIPEFEIRQIQVEWENEDSALVKRFRIEARHSANLFSEIEGAIRRRQGHLLEGRLEESPDSREAGTNRIAGLFTIQLLQSDDLKPVIKNIRSIPGILGIQLLNKEET